MKRRLVWGLAVVGGLLASTFLAVQPAHAATGIRVVNGVLVEANGTPLKLRGINHAHTWYPSQTSSFANIKAAGANSVRVVLSGGRWQPANGPVDVANVINLCKTNRLICVLENHDTTGFGEQGGAVSLDAAVDYWISVQSALTGQENYVILNIGNEPFGNNPVTPGWREATINAIQRLRNAGFQHTIMVDAPNWGQDWQFVMRDNAPQVLAADPTGNVIFSVHMYGVFDTAAEVNAYVDSFVSRNLALCICEFGFNHSDGNPDEDAIMAKAESAGIGLMGWSWSGNSGGVEYLDMATNFNPAQRTSWGNRFITGPNGLSTTSTEATIFGGSTPEVPGPPGTPTASAVTSNSVTLMWSASSGTVTGYQIERATGATSNSFTQVGTSITTSFTDTGLAANTTYRYRVRAVNAVGSSPYSGIVNVTTSGTSAGGCTATYTKVNEWPGGFQGEVRVTNTGSTPTTGWSVVVTFADGQQITQIWGGRTTLGSNPYTVVTEIWNGHLASNASTSFGFLGGWSGTDPAPSLSCGTTP
jgi:mannan endo-1,4-beta-mannosidase